jgi:hypothetical protein
MYCVIEEDDSKYWYGKMIDTLEIRVKLNGTEIMKKRNFYKKQKKPNIYLS